ncbi:MAG: ATPase [Helicobacteraceae bacterium CG2_30_36_10]|nr:MAG: ATPase [Helicobacteraceae bacterium CG2_30_36_10]
MIRFKLIDQFRSFYFRNYPDDMELLIEYFSVFGGLGWEVDVSKPVEVLIKELILENFELIHEKMEQLTLGEKNNQRLLRALAVGDRRIFSAFNRAGLNNSNGGSALNFLQEKGLIQIEYSREEPAKSLNPNSKLKKEIARHRISHKVLFTQPFVRFWFYFIAKYTKEIEAKNYTNVIKNFQERRNSYTSLVFEELSEVLLNYHLRDAYIISSGSYWDANVEIDILTITHDERVYVGECKWTNHKINKSELTKILDKCARLDIKPTQIALFSKRGFSKELLSKQGKDLALYSSEDFKALIKKSTKYELVEDFIVN